MPGSATWAGVKGLPFAAFEVLGRLLWPALSCMSTCCQPQSSSSSAAGQYLTSAQRLHCLDCP